MMLFKLSLKNIRKSFKDYAIYFFTLILGVCVFYVFNAIESQTVMLNASASTHEIIELMTSSLSGISVLVAFILGFLIIYASRFLIKRRNKEFGIYLTLGMSKRKVSLILLVETIFIGLISLGVGLISGVVLSQFMSMLVANMFEADLTNFTFIFSNSAFVKTLIYFSIMYFFVMIFNTVVIGKCKLIDLLHGSKKSEQIKLKNPILSAIVFLASASVLGYSYYMVTGGFDTLISADELLKPIIMGILSTFGIVFSLSGLLVRLVTKLKNIYFKGLNSFVLKQISSKINTTVFSMSIICLMLFVTICVLSSALSIKNSMTANLVTLAPIDIEFSKNYNLNEESVKNYYDVNASMIEDSYISLKETLVAFDFNIDKYLKDVVEVNTYSYENIKVQDTLGSYVTECMNKYPFLRYSMNETLVKLSEYNEAALLLGLDTYSLEDDEYILVADFEAWIPMRNEGLKRGTQININGKNYKPKYSEVKDGFIEISSNHVNMGLFIVPDEAVDENALTKGFLLANYDADADMKKEIEDIVLKMNAHPYAKFSSLDGRTRLMIYESSVGLGAMVTFIGLYLGIIFLISSAAILALKELSESSDNKIRYRMIRKIGADEAMINHALFKQIAVFFLFPLMFAIIHSIFGIIFCNNILETIGNDGLLESIVMTAIFIVFIYGGYFIITYVCSKNIIKEH